MSPSRIAGLWGVDKLGQMTDLATMVSLLKTRKIYPGSKVPKKLRQTNDSLWGPNLRAYAHDVAFLQAFGKAVMQARSKMLPFGGEDDHGYAIMIFGTEMLDVLDHRVNRNWDWNNRWDGNSQDKRTLYDFFREIGIAGGRNEVGFKNPISLKRFFPKAIWVGPTYRERLLHMIKDARIQLPMGVTPEQLVVTKAAYP
jgi:hypothetical protein